MWIVAVKENHYDPLWKDLGRGLRDRRSAITCSPTAAATASSASRSDRAAISSIESGAYDGMSAASMLADFVKQRDPKRIGVNMSDEIGPADGLSVTMLAHLKKTIGEPYASRLVECRETGVRVQVAPRCVRNRGVRRGRSIAVQLRERALSRRGHRRWQDHPRRRGLVAAGPITREGPRLGIRHAVHLRHRARMGSWPPPPIASSSRVTS